MPTEPMETNEGTQHPQGGSTQHSGDPSHASAAAASQPVSIPFDLFQQLMQNLQNHNRGPSLRDLPKDAVSKPLFRGPTKEQPRVRPSVVLTFLRRLHSYLSTYAAVLPTEELKLSTIGSCFPTDSRAASWFNHKRDTFDDLNDFETQFASFFGGTASDERQYKEKLLSFRQLDSDSVRDYYNKFCDLVSDINAIAFFLHGSDLSRRINPADQQSQFLHGLRPALRGEVNRIFARNPEYELDDLLQEAELFEKVNKSSQRNPRNPTFNGIQGQKGGRYANGCFFCKSFTHSDKDCKKIAARKAKGTWVDKKPPAQ